MAAPKIEFDKYGDIPVEASGRNCPASIDTWDQVELGHVIMENIKEAGYAKPTPIQRSSLPIVMGGRDLMGCAQTGSGKTAAFLLPILALLLKQGVNRGPSSYKAHPQALILAPTRELACQIQEEAKKFGFRTGIKSSVVYGGAPMNSQLWELKSGCDLLVATPGRLVDIIERGNVSLSRIRFLVLDEADRMLDMGFEPQIRKIVEQLDMPRTGQRHTLMFSATFPKEIQMLASSFLHDYIFLAVGRVGAATETVTQKFIQVEEHAKDQALFSCINTVPGLTLIFVETKKQAEYLGRMLQRQGVPAQSIHGDKQQALRTAALRSFSSGQTPFLIATNVAARGLDVDNVAHVINYDMPNTIEDYVHRIGRTGRAGKSGVATSFISSTLHGHVIPKLVELLQDANQAVPDWMLALRGSGFKSRSGPKSGPRFGGKDYRKQGGGMFGGAPSSSSSSYGGGGSSYGGASSSYGSGSSSYGSSRPSYPAYGGSSGSTGSGYSSSSYPSSSSTSSYGSSYPAPPTSTTPATSSYGGSGSSYGASASGGSGSSYGSSSYGSGSGSSSSYGSYGSGSSGSSSGSAYGSSSSSSRDYDKKRPYDNDDDRSGKRHSSSSSRDSYHSSSSSSSYPSSSSSSNGSSSYSSGSSSSSYPSSSSSSYPSSSYSNGASTSSVAKPPPPPSSSYGPPLPPGYAYPPPPPAAAYAAYGAMAYPMSMMMGGAAASTASAAPSSSSSSSSAPRY